MGGTALSATLSRRQFLTLSVGAALVGGSAAALGELLAVPTPAKAQGLIPLNVGMSFTNLDGVSAWIAQDNDFFGTYGLKVEIISIKGGTKTVTAMVAGDVPIALIGAADIIGARSRGFPVQMIGGVINRFSYDFVVAKNIASPTQLKGTKGAISGFGSSSDFAIRYALTTLGINLEDVTLLQTGDEPSRLAALQSGQIQFTVLTAGLDLVAFELGFKPLLKLYTLDQPYQHTGIAVQTAWAKSHKAIVDSFLKAIITANVYIKNPLKIAASLALIRKHLPINESYLKQGFQLYRDRFYSVYPFVTVPGMEFILRARKINQPVTDFFDNSYVQALKDANFAATVGK